MSMRARDRAVAVAAIAFAASWLPACSTQSGGTRPDAGPATAPERELAAYRERITDDYIRFEKSVEPSAENGFTAGEYYQRLYHPDLNPRTRSTDWLEDFEREHRGTPVGLEAVEAHLAWLGDSPRLEAVRAPAVYDLLREHYLGQEGMGEVCYLGSPYAGEGDYLAFLDQLVAENPYPSVKARALASRMQVLRGLGRFEEMRQCSMALSESHFDETYKNTPCGELAGGFLLPPHPEKAVQVGSVAPQIAGYDLDGRAVELGDFEDQVVVVVFFGFW